MLLIAQIFWLNSAMAQPGQAGSELWPQGEAGTDYNLTDASNKKEGQWVRVWPNGNL